MAPSLLNLLTTVSVLVRLANSGLNIPFPCAVDVVGLSFLRAWEAYSFMFQLRKDWPFWSQSGFASGLGDASGVGSSDVGGARAVVSFEDLPGTSLPSAVVRLVVLLSGALFVPFFTLGGECCPELSLCLNGREGVLARSTLTFGAEVAAGFAGVIASTLSLLSCFILRRILPDLRNEYPLFPGLILLVLFASLIFLSRLCVLLTPCRQCMIRSFGGWVLRLSLRLGLRCCVLLRLIARAM